VDTFGPSGRDLRTRAAGRYAVTVSHRWGDQTLQLSVTSPATFTATVDGATTRVSTEEVRGRRLDLTFTAPSPGPVTLVADNVAGWPPSYQMVETSSGRTVPEMGDSSTWRLPSAGRYRLEMMPTGSVAETTADVRLLSAQERSIAMNGPTTEVSLARRGSSAVYAIDVPAGEDVTVAATRIVRTAARGRAVVRVVTPAGIAFAGFDTVEDRLTRAFLHQPDSRWYVVVWFDGRTTGSLSLDVSTPLDYAMGAGDRARISTGGIAGRQVRVRFSVAQDEYIGLGRFTPARSSSTSTRVARSDDLRGPRGTVLGDGTSDVYHAPRAEELVLIRSPRLPVVLDEEVVVQRVRARPAEVDRRERLDFPDGRTFTVRRYAAPPGTRLVGAVVDSDVDPVTLDLRVRGARTDLVVADRARVEVGDQPVDFIVFANGPRALDLQVTTPQRVAVTPDAPPVRISTGDLVGREAMALFEARAGDVITARTSARDGWTTCFGELMLDLPGGPRTPGYEDVVVVSEGHVADRDADGCLPPDVVEVRERGPYLYRFSPRGTTRESADVEVMVSRPTLLEQPGQTPTTYEATVGRPGAIATFRISAREWNQLRLTVSGGTFRTADGRPAAVDVTVKRPYGANGSTPRLRHVDQPVTGTATINGLAGPDDDTYLVVVDPLGDATGTVDLTFEERYGR
jgi:hypothetical protein